MSDIYNRARVHERNRFTSHFNLGIIGTGGMAEQRARAFAELGVRVTAVYGRNPAKAATLAQSVGASRATDEIDELFDAVDAVVVCLPNNLHAEFAALALGRDKHVLV